MTIIGEYVVLWEKCRGMSKHDVNNFVPSYSKVEVKRKSEERSPSDQKKMHYPDASKWGVDDVVRFFTNLGYKDQAEALQEQVRYKGVFCCKNFCLEFSLEI
jgi:hypothetical protein